MTNESTTADDALDDPRVVQALDEYVSAKEAGRRLDRVAFLAAHDDIAGPLAKCLDGLAFVQSAAPQLAPPVDAVDLDNATPLGDFRLIRVIGRGGMGTVYEAEQLSLGRRVALKVLPFAAALDPKQLQRFKNEAQAAAHLQHAHIVPVYGVGCERGVHYYAMQLIEGRSLAEVIRAWREQSGLEATTTAIGDLTPVQSSRTTDSSAPDSHHYCRLARLVRQAAEGLEHAHQCGVIHRDVKPANLLVDAADQLWITDFGLAQFHDHLGVTMTGDVLGTLRYMSPEQAAARREMIDHRTDVYSLGATLYELLTLEPAVAGTDRQALVRQITDTEPVPPGRLKPDLPVDLETIVLKALGKAPAERYRTAQDMADDLQRFLDDRPVLARRPTLWQRGSKAVRRHRTLFATLVLSLFGMLSLAVVMLAISARRVADREAKIHANYLEAKKQYERAEENFKKTLAVVDRFLVRVGDTKLASNAHTVGIRRDLLLDALHYFEEFLAERKDDPSLRFEIAAAHRRLGTIQSHLGQSALAKEAYQRGLEICDQLVAESPDNLEYRHELALCCYWISHYANEPHAHEKLVRRAAELWRGMSAPARFEHHKWLALADQNLAYQLATDDRVAESERHYKSAAQANEQWLKAAPTDIFAHEYKAHTWTSYGLLLRQSERYDEAENALRLALQSLALVNRLVPNRDQEPTHRNVLSRVLGHLSHVLWRRHRREEALKTSQEATAGWRSLATATPSQFERTELALTLHQQASWLAILRRPQEAEEAYREALREIASAAQEPGETVGGGPRQGDVASINLAMIRASLGQFLHDEGRRDEAAEVFDVALRTYQQMQTRLPEDPDLAARVAWLRLTCPIDRFRDHTGALKLAQHAVQRAPRRASHWGTLGLAQYRAGDYQAAVVSLEKAASLRTSGGGTSGFILAMAHFRLGNPTAAREEFTRTAAWMDQGRHEHADLRHFRAEAEKLIPVK